jgi:anti-sigma factor RsiW
MHCPPFDDLSAYVDHMLKPRARTRLHAHVEVCPDCQRQLHALHTLRSRLQEMPSPELGFDLGARLQDHLRAASDRQRQMRTGWAWSGWLPAGLAAAAMASGVWLGGLLVTGSTVSLPRATMVRVFDPVPPGGLCAAAELCNLSKGMP